MSSNISDSDLIGTENNRGDRSEISEEFPTLLNLMKEMHDKKMQLGIF